MAESAKDLSKEPTSGDEPFEDVSEPDRRGIGALGERLACRQLWRRGFRILERNYHVGRAEIDIIAEKRGRIHFVEVKTSRAESHSLGRPEERLDPEQRNRVRAAASRYLEDFAEPPPAGFQFDAVSLRVDSAGRLAHCEWYEDAF